MPLPPAVDADLYTADEKVTRTLTPLPDSLTTAIALAENSVFLKDTVGQELMSKYLEIKKSEAVDFTAARDKDRFYKERYFRLV